MKLEGIENIRDLGGIVNRDGKRIRKGLLIRSAGLGEMSDGDAEYLCSMGLKTVIDLRSSREREEKPDREVEGVENIHIPVFTESVLGISRDKRSMQEMKKTMWHDMPYLYRSMVAHPMAPGNFGKVLSRIIAQKEGAVLWHCSAGKDRCGMSSVLCLHLLNVDREIIFEDYLKSNESAIPFSKKVYEKILKETGDKEQAKFMEKLYIADRDYLEASFEQMDISYGDIDGFIENGLKLTKEQIAAFRERCLE